MSLLVARDPITYVVQVDPDRLAVNRCRAHLTKGYTAGPAFELENDALLYVHDEGVNWIRGNHTTTSPEGAALLAAFKLAYS